MTLIIVRVYRYALACSGGTWHHGLDLASPEIAKFKVKPNNSAETVLRDIMFLDEMDLLVIGTIEGISTNPIPTHFSRDDPRKRLCHTHDV